MKTIHIITISIVALFFVPGFCGTQLLNEEYNNKKYFEKKIFVGALNPDSISFQDCDFLLKGFGDYKGAQKMEFVKISNHYIYQIIKNNAGNVIILKSKPKLKLHLQNEESFFMVPLVFGSGKKAKKINFKVPNITKLKEYAIDADFCFIINHLKFSYIKSSDKEYAEIEASYIFWDYNNNKPAAHGVISIQSRELILKEKRWDKIYKKLLRKIFNKSPFTFYNSPNWYLNSFIAPVSKDTNSIIVKGNISRKDILEDLKPSLIKINELFSNEISKKDSISGKVYLKLTIGNDGKIIEDNVIFSSFDSPYYAKTIVNEIAKCTFTKIGKLKETAEIILPFIIDSKNKGKKQINPMAVLLSMIPIAIIIVLTVRFVNNLDNIN